MRYDSNTILKNENGDRYYDTTIYPPILPSDSDIVITTKLFDRLDKLALQYYNNKSLWYIIALANNLGKGSLTVPPGIELRIPTNLGDISTQLTDLNNNR